MENTWMDSQRLHAQEEIEVPHDLDARPWVNIRQCY